MRQCGDCQLCCKLLPVHGGLRVNGKDLPGNFHKPAGERCPHQRFKKGCAVYGKPKMPPACRLWNCRWLVNDDTDALSRPDRSHYVLDITPDFITLRDDNNGSQRNIPVVQIWCDPNYRDAWRDPHLLAYLERRGRDGIAALIRFNSKDAITLFPPSMAEDRQWHEIHNGAMVPERTVDDFIKAFGTMA